MATKAQKSTALLTGTSPDNWSHQDAVQFLEAAQTVGDLSAMHTHVNEALAEDVSKIEEAPEETFKVVTVEPDPKAELEGRVAGLLFSVTGPAQYKQFKAGHKDDFAKAALGYLELVEGHKAEWRKLNTRYLELNPKPETMAEQESEADHWVYVAQEQQKEARWLKPSRLVNGTDERAGIHYWFGEAHARARALELYYRHTPRQNISIDNRAIVWPKEEPVEQYCEEQIVQLKTAGNVYAEYKDDELKAICRTFSIKGFSKGTKANRACLIAEHFGLEQNLMAPVVEQVDEVTEEVVVFSEIEEAEARWAYFLKEYSEDEDSKELSIACRGWEQRVLALKARAAGDMEEAKKHIDAHRALRAEYKALSTKTDRDVEAAVVDHHLEGDPEEVAERILQDAARAHVPAQMYRNDEGELVVRVHEGKIRLTNIRMDISFIHNAYMRVEKWINKGWICHVEAI